jgi:tetratricopeptide (TPR) repeat protein
MPRLGLVVAPMLTTLLLLLPTIQAHAQEEEEFTFGAEDVGNVLPVADIMDAGVQKYDRKDYAGASLDFFKIVEAVDDPEAEKFRQKAEYMLGRTLYQLGYYQSALSFFDRVVETGSEHRYYRATHKMLYLIYKKLGDPAIVEKIARYDRADYDERFRADLLFTVGYHHYLAGNLDDAVTHLQGVPRESTHYAKANFLKGILYVRKNQAKPAVESFKEILRVVADDPDSVRDPLRYQRLAWLSLARIFYSTGQFTLALKYYDRIPTDSEEWLQALLESAWAFYHLDKQETFEKALGNLHTLGSPYFSNEYFPEAHLLRAIIYFTTCNYDQVRKTLESFVGTHSDLKDSLDGYLAQYEDPAAFWEFLLTLNQGGGDFGARTQQIFNAAFSDRSLARMHRYIRKVDAELKGLRVAQGAWGQSGLAATLVQDAEVVKALAIQSAGELARARLGRVVGELAELISQSRKVQFETANAEMGQLENRLRDDQYSGGKARPLGDLTTPDDAEHVYWPFEGEYWKDELGQYVYTVRARCGR